MQIFFQTGDSEQRPVWLRLLAMLCVLVVCMMSTVLAYHTHADFSALKQNSQHNSPATDDHCPLCVAMHSALPVSLHVTPEPMLQIQSLHSVAADARRIFRWRFEMASRPPPLHKLCS